MKMRETSRDTDKKLCVNNYLTWANQVRILAQSFEALGAVVGGTLINAFRPLLQALNTVIGKIIQFARTVSDALGAIFGWEFQVSESVGIANDGIATLAAGADDTAGGLGKAAKGAGDTAGGLGDAAKNAKKLNDYMADWQEVNNMTSDQGSGSGGSGGSGGGGGGAGGGGGVPATGSAGEWVQTETLWEKYTSDIDTLYKLGEYIGDVLTDALNSIDWDSVYEGARNFGTGLAQFLNGLISPELFGAVGRTIAGALNAAIYAALAFGEEFDWQDFGLSIATGINEFFSTFDFVALAETINVWANGLLDALITALEETNWYAIGQSIGEFLANLDWPTILAKVGKAIILGINAAFQAYIGLVSVAPLEGAIVAGVAAFKFKGLRKAVMTAMSASLGKDFVLSLPKLSLMLPKISFTLGTGAGVGIAAIADEILWRIEEAIRNDGGEGLLTALGEWVTLAVGAGIGAIIGGPIGAAIGFVLANIWVYIDVDGAVRSFWDGLVDKFFNWDASKQLLEAASENFRKAFTAENFWEFGKNIVEGVVNGFLGAIGLVVEPITDFLDYISQKICEIFGINSPAETMKPFGQYILEGIIEGFRDTFGEWTQALNDWFNDKIAPWFTAQKWKDLYITIKNSLKDVWDETVRQWSNDVSAWWNSNVAPWFTLEKWRTVAEGIKSGIKAKWDETAGQWITDITSWWNNNVAPWFTADKWRNVAGGIKTGLESAFNAAVSGVKNIWNSFASWLNSKLSFDIPAINIMGETVFGGAHINLGRLPTFAKGGIVDGATLAVVGEAGKEAIMPLERNTGWIKSLSRNISSDIGRYGRINVMPDTTKYEMAIQSSINLDRGNRSYQVSDEQVVQFVAEIRKQNRILEEQNEILERVYQKTGVTESQIFDANRRLTKNFINRTGKMPYPVV